jgi:hypothetical protein
MGTDVKCTENEWVAIDIYLDRLSTVDPEIFIKKNNYHYILLAMIILHLKMYDDTYYENSFYSRWTHSNLSILNRTEMRLFRCLPLMITPEQFEQHPHMIDIHQGAQCAQGAQGAH